MMDTLVGLVILGAVLYWLIKMGREGWVKAHPPRQAHEPGRHTHRPVLRWTDRTETFLETVHMCKCGHVREDDPPEAGESGTLAPRP